MIWFYDDLWRFVRMTHNNHTVKNSSKFLICERTYLLQPAWAAKIARIPLPEPTSSTVLSSRLGQSSLQHGERAKTMGMRHCKHLERNIPVRICWSENCWSWRFNTNGDLVSFWGWPKVHLAYIWIAVALFFIAFSMLRPCRSWRSPPGKPPCARHLPAFPDECLDAEEAQLAGPKTSRWNSMLKEMRQRGMKME